MSPRIKVYGCGSAGMHLAHGAYLNGWSVDMVDVSASAIYRVPDIYAKRYGMWPSEGIRRYLVDSAPTDDYDICVVATPPATHIALAIEAWEKHDPHAVLIEKPLCTPGQCGEIRALAGTRTFVGYTHLLAAAQFNLRHATTLNVDFREAWHYVLAAHSWNIKPGDTYLGFADQGGGACSEHSHAISMWEHLARPDHGDVVRVSARMTMTGAYDSCAWLTLITEDGFTGYATMDTVCDPSRKVAWSTQEDGGRQTQEFGKCDFAAELEHVYNMVMLAPGTSMLWTESPLALSKGASTARIIRAAHRSAQEGTPVDV